ncbi:unnamed protein product [Didymodactylos carnosus]|uniref:Condensation domain-containing protein n=1 Tax=Didymodactylos carnosus TaxID=1234261 RepID=A0A814XS65_9BILA|nr:unnamed protein product [Didymodactylos carnosus]CAF1219705.1 unnamed protein product [Didymodactylos carnosus]CAF3748711.1 unnamed protein product [Didymodactylos carnosus]CAF3983240.1 unnamed protein product [Didymodactylos carnosus]
MLKCHLINVAQQQQISSNKEELLVGSYILFLFHHIVFDGTSTDLFLNDLREAYRTQTKLTPLPLQYIDCSQYERHMDMSEARSYWLQQLAGYETELQLP